MWLPGFRIQADTSAYLTIQTSRQQQHLLLTWPAAELGIQRWKTEYPISNHPLPSKDITYLGASAFCLRREEKKFLFTFLGFIPFTLLEKQNTASCQCGILNVWHSRRCSSYFTERYTQHHNNFRRKNNEDLTCNSTFNGGHIKLVHFHSTYLLLLNKDDKDR